jgi:hypothetical protein
MRLRLMTAGALAIMALTAAASATAQHIASHPFMQLDRNLVVSLPAGWTSAGGPVVSGQGHSATGGEFVVAGNFALRPALSQVLKGKLPAPPAGKVVVRIIDLPNNTPTANWQHVNRLHLPTVPTNRRIITWNVTFANEAVQISARTGSTHLTATEKTLIDSVLAKVQHT